MPTYNKLTVKELRQTCDSRGVSHDGLTKKGMIAALRHADVIEEERRDDGFGLGDVESDDGEVIINSELGAGVDVGQSGGGSAVRSSSISSTDGDNAGQESVAVLQLKLALLKEKREMQKEIDERARLAKEQDFELEQRRAEFQAVNQAGTTARPTARGEIHSLLPKMSEGENTLEFFQTFERALLLNNVDRNEWPLFLPSHLTPRANKVLSGLTLEENRSYDSCKKAILAYFKLDTESYLRSFRTTRKLVDESLKMYKNRLREFFVYYVQSLNVESFDELADVFLMEQFVNMLPVDVKSFVLSRQPKTADECGELADLFTQMSRNTGGQGAGQTQGVNNGQANKTQNDSAQRQGSRNFAQTKPNANGFGQTKTNAPYNGVPKTTLLVMWVTRPQIPRLPIAR